MVAILLSSFIVLVFICLLKRIKIDFSVSIGLLLFILISIVSTVCLHQNYTASLVPNSEGIAISNSFAYFIISEKYWTITLFKRYADVSTYVTIALIIMLVPTAILEKVLIDKNKAIT
ncbi:MAG TPA: hypothetical protein VKZ77_10720 [Bacillaceae bacterium]|nr:hypothetical protein [Paenibacillus bovis]HLU22928.1 hypothetical protein [Bacillaceae bacterium]